MIYCKEIDEYIKFVEENPDETDDEIKLLIENIVKPTLSRDDVFFDAEMLDKAIRYCEKWYYKLFPYQKFAYALFFMYDKNNPDIVIFPDILILMARRKRKRWNDNATCKFFTNTFLWSKKLSYRHRGNF